MTDDLLSVHMTPRGVGKNWLPCAWCGYSPPNRGVQSDLACFVASEDHGRAALRIFEEAGMIVNLNLSRASEDRFQVKIGACNVHEPNLHLLYTVLHRHELTVGWAKFTVPGVNPAN